MLELKRMSAHSVSTPLEKEGKRHHGTEIKRYQSLRRPLTVLLCARVFCRQFLPVSRGHVCASLWGRSGRAIAAGYRGADLARQVAPGGVQRPIAVAQPAPVVAAWAAGALQSVLALAHHACVRREGGGLSRAVGAAQRIE